MRTEMERKIDEQWQRMEDEHDGKVRDMRQNRRTTALLVAYLAPLILFVLVYLIRLAWDLAGGAL